MMCEIAAYEGTTLVWCLGFIQQLKLPSKGVPAEWCHILPNTGFSYSMAPPTGEVLSANMLAGCLLLVRTSTISDKLWNKSEMWCWSVIPNCQMFSDRSSSTGLEQKVHFFRVLYLITLTGVGGACCPPRPEALPPMLIYVTSDCTVKLVCVFSARK